MKILKNYYTEEEFYMSFTVYKFILFSLSGYQRKFDSQFPHILYINEKILMKY